MKDDESTSDWVDEIQGCLQNHSDFKCAMTLCVLSGVVHLSHSLLLVSKRFPRPGSRALCVLSKLYY